MIRSVKVTSNSVKRKSVHKVQHSTTVSHRVLRLVIIT
jgi:hypothetical protein